MKTLPVSLPVKGPVPFTRKLIAELQLLSSGQSKVTEISDAKETGLKIIFRPGGASSYILRTSVGGISHYLPVGKVSELPLEEARHWVRTKKAELRQRAAVMSGHYGAVYNMTFNSLLQHYVRDVLVAGAKRSAHTDLSKIKKYLGPQLGNIRLSAMQESDIAHYLAGLPVKPSTRNRHLALLKAVFSYARRMRYITASPAEFLRMQPEATSQRKAMSREEFRQWMAVCEAKYHQNPGHAGIALLMFLGLTGLRLGETRYLKMTDIDWSRKTIVLRQTKNGKTRVVPVCDKAFVLLTTIKQYLGDKDWAFPNQADNGPVSEPRRLQKSLCESAGIRHYTIHELRHTFATTLIESGADIYTVKDLLGHSTIKVTEIYLHASPARYHDVINRAMA